MCLDNSWLDLHIYSAFTTSESSRWYLHLTAGAGWSSDHILVQGGLMSLEHMSSFLKTVRD